MIPSFEYKYIILHTSAQSTARFYLSLLKVSDQFRKVEICGDFSPLEIIEIGAIYVHFEERVRGHTLRLGNYLYIFDIKYK